jgi:hypothetical protein
VTKEGKLARETEKFIREYKEIRERKRTLGIKITAQYY